MLPEMAVRAGFLGHVGVVARPVDGDEQARLNQEPTTGRTVELATRGE